MKYFLIFVSVILVSMYFFPFEFVSFRGINTKHMMAGLGALCFSGDILLARKIEFSRELFVASLIAVLFSIIGFYSTDFNSTYDYAYATYIGSMWVWFIACYGVCTFIKITHGYISINLIVNYLVAVCLFQSIIALCINFVPEIKMFVNSVFVTGDLEFMEKTGRIYGIGASLDVAGGRFALVLAMMAVMANDNAKIKGNSLYLFLYVLAFLIIGVCGSMMARTTTVGIALGMLYVFFKSHFFSQSIKVMGINFLLIIIATVGGGVAAAIYFYNVDKEFQVLIQFAFEGFFNYINTGVWETDSTEVLKDMWVFPEDLKTWIIGDGYFADPITGAFYKTTDVGYLRFIYYSGLIGLFAFSSLFVYLSIAFSIRFPYVKSMFFLCLVMVFVNWLKVATDLFLAYAFFLVICQPSFFNKYYKKDFQVA